MLTFKFVQIHQIVTPHNELESVSSEKAIYSILVCLSSIVASPLT